MYHPLLYVIVIWGRFKSWTMITLEFAEKRHHDGFIITCHNHDYHHGSTISQHKLAFSGLISQHRRQHSLLDPEAASNHGEVALGREPGGQADRTGVCVCVFVIYYLNICIHMLYCHIFLVYVYFWNVSVLHSVQIVQGIVSIVKHDTSWYDALMIWKLCK